MHRRLRRALAPVSFALVSLALMLPATARADTVVGPGGGTPGTSSNFTLVGHAPLYNRGMNAALALYDHYAYVGNRTDGSSTCGAGDPRGPGTTCPHPHPGVQIVDVADPAHPTVVGEIGPPYEGNVGITSRELRVWPQQKLLVVMNFRCSSVIHACAKGTDATFPYDFKFYDLTDPVHPRYLSRYVPTSRAGKTYKPHEMFLWVDPKDANRALLYITTPNLTVDPSVPNLIIADLSQVPAGGAVSEVAEGNWNGRYPGTDSADYPFKKDGSCGPYNCNLFVHSVGLTPDGTRAYLSMEAGEFLVLDTSQVAAGTPNPSLTLQTDPANRPTWDNPNGHSAVQVYGRPIALTTDEVYGTFTAPDQGCPWGWMRLINVTDVAHPAIVGAYKLPQDTCPAPDAATEQFTSYSSHNPTVLRDLAFIAWHSGGLQAIDLADETHPTQAGWFSPTPLDTVATEDPALGRGPNKVIMWSYPIIRDGLIYVVDIRNGLYILRYTGPRADEVQVITFLEGNSNLGDAATLAAGSGTGAGAGGGTATPELGSGELLATGLVPLAAILLYRWRGRRRTRRQGGDTAA